MHTKKSYNTLLSFLQTPNDQTRLLLPNTPFSIPLSSAQFHFFSFTLQRFLNSSPPLPFFTAISNQLAFQQWRGLPLAPHILKDFSLLLLTLVLPDLPILLTLTLSFPSSTMKSLFCSMLSINRSSFLCFISFDFLPNIWNLVYACILLDPPAIRLISALCLSFELL